MMDPMSGIFRSRKVCAARLPDYGFLDEGGTYTYSTLLPGSGFLMSVKIARDGSVQAAVTDPETDEPYTLHLAGGAVGGFVGGVRAEYRPKLPQLAGLYLVEPVRQQPYVVAVMAGQQHYRTALFFLHDQFADQLHAAFVQPVCGLV